MAGKGVPSHLILLLVNKCEAVLNLSTDVNDVIQYLNF